ncbi:kinase-like domain-containing protein [Hypoxylon crocopeplum]|nr:kinase-like domain-containing protein [Hypoxylon crocopeplum]
MAPEITHFNDMDFVAESFDPETSDFLYTTFAVIERDDAAYFGQLSIRKLKLSLKEYTSALVRLPDAEIYPEFPQGGELTPASDELTSNLYVKRPRLFTYEEYKAQDCVDIIPALLLEEAHTLEAISRHPHPNIIGYHGCRVRRGFVTGLVLDRHVSDLKNYINDRTGPLDKGPFMDALESAINHLHSLGLAHNDINPRNILVNAAGMPVLIDFDSCRPVGKKLTYSRGTPGWIDKDESYDTSETRHDTFAINKIRTWLDEQTVGS